jgi:hypothetical protein
MVEPVFMKLGMYIMAPEPVSTAYFINPSHQSVCLYVYRFFVARQWLGKNTTAIFTKQQWKNFWTCPFLCGPQPIKGTYAIASSQNFLFGHVFVLNIGVLVIHHTSHFESDFDLLGPFGNPSF